MKPRTILCLSLALALAAVPALATEQQTTIPVTLTVVHTVHSIDVTMPAALPVSVVDGTVLAADNVQIKNNSNTDAVVVSAIQVESAEFTVTDFDNFQKDQDKTVALSINGCSTKGPGELTISEQYFPTIPANGSMPLVYEAKVSDNQEVSGVEVARVVFTLRAENA